MERKEKRTIKPRELTPFDGMEVIFLLAFKFNMEFSLSISLKITDSSFILFTLLRSCVIGRITLLHVSDVLIIYCITEFCDFSLFVFLCSWTKKLLSPKSMSTSNCSTRESQRRSGALLSSCNLLAILITWKSFYTTVIFQSFNTFIARLVDAAITAALEEQEHF